MVDVVKLRNKLGSFTLSSTVPALSFRDVAQEVAFAREARVKLKSEYEAKTDLVQ